MFVSFDLVSGVSSALFWTVSFYLIIVTFLKSSIGISLSFQRMLMPRLILVDIFLEELKINLYNQPHIFCFLSAWFEYSISKPSF